MEPESKNSTLVNRAKGVAPRASPLTKIINSSFLFSLKEGLMDLAANHSKSMLTTRPTIRIRITIAQKTYEWVMGLSGDYSSHSTYHTMMPMIRNIKPSLILATNRNVFLNNTLFTWR